MLGVNYESSDEEEQLPATTAKLANIPVAAISVPQVAPQKATPPPSAPVNGPAQGPAVLPSPADGDAADDVPPGSPYTSNRAIIQNLTLPTVPNFEIPASPPGSPPQQATKKFAQFLELKNKGQHFNQRLESSSVLRDPGHSQKLMNFAGISEEEQHASVLSKGLAVPAVFPPWAYVEELKASQKRIFKAKEQEKARTPREAIDFVSATKSGAASRTSIPSGKMSTSHSASKRKELEHRSREGSLARSGRRSTSRSPKRRR
ncbi:hypothetical protein M3J09_011307 [Ascochyta lentis]